MNFIEKNEYTSSLKESLGNEGINEHLSRERNVQTST